MAFPFFRNKKKPEEQTEMTTLEQARKAYEDLSDDDKKSFHQSIADRIHESIGEQEHDDGNEDSQSAAAREHEALGAEHADGKGEVSELHEKDDTPEEKREDHADEFKALHDEVAKLRARVELMERTSQPADKTTADKLNELTRRYTN